MPMVVIKPLQLGIPMADIPAVTPVGPNSVKEYPGPSDLLASILLTVAAGRPKGDAVKLKHPCSPLMPSEHGDQGRYLRPTKLPAMNMPISCSSTNSSSTISSLSSAPQKNPAPRFSDLASAPLHPP